MGFEWRTSDDDSPPPGWREEKRKGRIHTPRWRWYLLMAFVGLGAGIILWRLAERRIDASVTQLESEVRLSQSLVDRAAAASDPELLRTVLSGRDDDWAEAQRELVAEGRGYTAVARLLGLEPEGTPEVLSITLDPSLRSAELVVTQLYTAAPSAELAEPAVLELPLVFRRGANRWLLAPPEPEFWGPRHSVRTDVAEFRFPERDGAVVRLLAEDLTADVSAMCALLASGCSKDLLLTVTFDADIRSVFRFEDGRSMLQSGKEISLPAPSLIGIPQDDAGYNALRSTYARYLLSALVPVVTGWECCDEVLFWQALQQERLHQLGLAPALLPPWDSIQALELTADIDQFFVTLSQKWQIQTPSSISAPLPLEVRILISYFLAPPEGVSGAEAATITELEAALIDLSSFGRWWSSFTSVRPGQQSDLQPALRAFVQESYEAQPLPSGLTLPDEDLLAVCGSQGEEVWRYDLHADSWTLELDLESHTGFAMVVSEESYYVAALNFEAADEDFPQFQLLRKRVGEPAERLATDGSTIWIPLAKHGNPVPAALLDEETGDAPRVAMLDLQQCNSGGCSWEETPGFVESSPGSEYELASSIALLGTKISLRRSGKPWQEVAEGAFPVWLDAETFAYMDGQLDSRYVQVFVQNVAGQSALLVDSKAIEKAAGTAEVPWLALGVVREAAPATFFVLATAGSDSYVLEVPRPANGSWLVSTAVTPTLRAQTKGQVTNLVTPPVRTGRWLVTTLSVPGTQPAANYWVVDLSGEQPPVVVRGAMAQFVLPAFDISTDGNWLAWPTLGGIGLMAPGHRTAGEPYRRWLPFETSECLMVAWSG